MLFLWGERGGAGTGLTHDNVDAAHLLGNHDGEGGQGRPAHPRNGEQLAKPLQIPAPADDAGLNLNLGVDVVEVSGG